MNNSTPFQDGVRLRLQQALKRKGLSMRAASLAADKGAGYVQSLLKAGSDPQISKLAEVCDANEISLAYVILGVEMSEETKRLIELFQNHPEKRDGILALLDS